MVHSCNHIQQGGFSSTGFADHAQKFTPLDFRVDTAQRGEIAGNGFVDFVYLPKLDERLVMLCQGGYFCRGTLLAECHNYSFKIYGKLNRLGFYYTKYPEF